MWVVVVILFIHAGHDVHVVADFHDSVKTFLAFQILQSSTPSIRITWEM